MMKYEVFSRLYGREANSAVHFSRMASTIMFKNLSPQDKTVVFLDHDIDHAVLYKIEDFSSFV